MVSNSCPTEGSCMLFHLRCFKSEQVDRFSQAADSDL